MNNDVLKAGRVFLILLQKTEDLIRQSETTYFPSMTVLQIRNWKHVLAFILRKLSALLEGSTDYDFEIKKPFFRLVAQKGGSDEN
ncbi:hypothetical protein K2P97_06795 [bacterium]|nr:hypothetical protein [bacterium]